MPNLRVPARYNEFMKASFYFYIWLRRKAIAWNSPLTAYLPSLLG